MNKPISMNKVDIQSWAKSQALAEFGHPKKAEIATNAVGLGIDCIKTMPIGWNKNNTHKDFEKRLYNHISARLNPKPYGFFILPGMGWFFLQMIGGLISWAVQKLMNLYFNK